LSPLSASAVSPRLRRSLPRPLRELAQRLLALRRFDSGVVDLPPPRAKRRHLLNLFRERGHDCFVEAGTYLGDTVQFFLPHAGRIVSVELDDELWRAATERFRDQPKVTIVRGDAEQEIPRIVGELEQPPLVWLDGHHSGDDTAQGEHAEPAVAIVERLGQVNVPPGTTIVVDDLRLFGRLPEFPPLESLTGAARAAWPQAQIRIGLDSLVIAI
jgi:predicted O-methyltransferase YrrM